MAEVVLNVFRGDQDGGSEQAYAVPLVTGMISARRDPTTSRRNTLGTWRAQRGSCQGRPTAARAAPKSTAGRA